MRKDELFCFVCIPFVNERGSRKERSDCDVNYMLLNMIVCDKIESVGYTPISLTHLWGSCFKYNYNKERIIQAGGRLIDICERFYFCDCEYDEKAHEEMEIWRIKAQILNKRFISIDRKFLE